MSLKKADVKQKATRNEGGLLINFWSDLSINQLWFCLPNHHVIYPHEVNRDLIVCDSAHYVKPIVANPFADVPVETISVVSVAYLLDH